MPFKQYCSACLGAMTRKKNVHSCKSDVMPLETQNAWSIARKPIVYDCYGVLETIGWIWRVLGIFPLTINNSMGKKKYNISKFFAVHSFLIYIACSIQIIYSLTTFRKDNVNILTTNLIMRVCANLVCLFVSNVWRILRHTELSNSIATMAVQEINLEKMGSRLNRERAAKIVRAYVWATTVVVIFLQAYEIWASGPTLLITHIQWLLWGMPQMIQILDLTIFGSLIGLLGSEFRVLNEQINTVVIRANASSPKVIVTSDVCAEKLRMVAKIHYSICAVGKRLNGFFSCDVIINVITAFTILSTSLYYIFVEVQREGDTNYIRIGTYVQWEIIHSFPIILVVVICNWTSYQGIRAGKLIHEIRVERTDSRLYETVRSFSLQLHHQKLEFTAGGFFPLNATLLQAIVGNITTYLVILIQFQPKLI